MAVNFNKRFIHVSNKATFVANNTGWEQTALTNGCIIFFQDTLEIWVRGTYYGASQETLNRISAVEEGLAGLNYITEFTSDDGGKFSADGATVVPMNSGKGIKIVCDASGVTFTSTLAFTNTDSIEISETEDGSYKADLRIDTTNPGNVTLTVTENGLKAEAEIPEVEYPITGVVEGDKVLSLDENKAISATLSVKYDSDTKHVQLLGIGQELISEFDASEFVADGMLNDVTVVNIVAGETEGSKVAVDTSNEEITYTDFPTTAVVGECYLRFIWNTDAGDKVDYVKTSDLADLKTKNLEVSETIPVAGGPLASLLNNKGITSIDAGTSMQDLLFTLFCEEQWPNPAAKYAYDTLTSTLSAPTASAAYANNGKVVEVGSSQSIGTITGKSATANAPYLKFDNFTWGYLSAEGKGTATSTKTNPAQVAATVNTNSVTYTLSRKYTKFNGAQAGTAQTGSDGTALTFAAETLTASLGENKVVYTISASGQVHSATVKAPSVYYAMSNLGNTNKLVNGVSTAQQKVDATTNKTLNPNPTTPASKTLTYTCTGVYPVYTNANATGNIAAATAKVVANASVFEVEYGAEGSNFHKFKFPASHTLSTVEVWNAQANKYDSYVGGQETSAAEDTTINGGTYSYKTWTRKGSAYTEPTKFRFTLNKSTSAE